MNDPLAPRFYAFWAINGPLERDRLFHQLGQFKAAGLDGVVWHPRFYPGTPPYLGEAYVALVSEVILRAKALGLRFWIYDEDGWPSGTVGGQLLQKYPGDAQRWAGLVRERPERCLAEFEQGGIRWYLSENIGPGVDYLNPELARHFLELTYDRYRDGLAPEAFAHVEVFFCDEPEFGLGHAYDNLPRDGALPWTPRLPGLFRERFGEELAPLVPLLFFPGTRAAEVRVKFWELLTDLFGEAFLTPLDAWCRAHGKRFTAHVKGEEHPLFQIPTSGSCHQVFRRLALPGIDALERYPANDFFPRQVSAAARQFGDGRCMVEAFGGSGWGVTPGDLERYLLWLGRNGLTDFVLHLSQYRLDSAAMHDWPPSQPLHLTWSHLYAEVIARVRAELTARPRPPADTLVVAPYRGIMGVYTTAELAGTNIHDAGTYPATDAGRANREFLALIDKLHAAGVAYDVADERTVEDFGRAEDGALKVGASSYRHVVLDTASDLAAPARALVRPFAKDAATLIAALAPTTVRAEKTRLSAGLPVSWTLAESLRNLLLLETSPQVGGGFAATFSTRGLSAEDAALELVFADDIATATLNGEALVPTPSAEGSLVSLAAVELADAATGGVNVLQFECSRPVSRPFVWLRGRFRADSATVFSAGPGDTLKTDGPFTLTPARFAVANDLVSDGFAFLRETLVAEATVRLPRGITTLRLDEVVADAARLTVRGKETAWVWSDAGEYRFNLALPAGEHRVRLELVPSTFNAFGPHHYYGGDWFVVSPDQIKGVRNFADPVDAPDHTHVAAWHFRRFELPAGVSVN